jgi:hypothetical protein
VPSAPGGSQRLELWAVGVALRLAVEVLAFLKGFVGPKGIGSFGLSLVNRVAGNME